MHPRSGKPVQLATPVREEFLTTLRTGYGGEAGALAPPLPPDHEVLQLPRQVTGLDVASRYRSRL